MAVLSWRLSVLAELRADPARDVQQCQHRPCSCAVFRHSHPEWGEACPRLCLLTARRVPAGLTS